MPLRIPLALGLICLALLPASAYGWGDVDVRDSPGGAIASCLRPTGDERTATLVGPVRGRSIEYQALDLDGLVPQETMRLGQIVDCPVVARSGFGPLLVVATDFSRGTGVVLRASVNGVSRAFRRGTVTEDVAAAASATGETLIAWVQRRGAARRETSQARLVVSRSAPGAGMSPPVALTAWRRSGDFPSPVAAAYDASGRATVAWAAPLLARGAVDGLTRVVSFSAAPGGAFSRPQQIGRVAQDVARVTLAVAPNGRALLAFDGNESIQAAERASADGPFVPLAIPGLAEPVSGPAVAIRSDGGAVLAWRGGGAGYATGEIIGMTSRATGNAYFSEARAVVEPTTYFDDSLGTSSLIFAIGRRASAPLDEGNVELSAALAEDGQFVLAWAAPRRPLLGTRPLAAHAAAGSLDRGVGRVATLGCACRSVNGIRALATPGGPAVAYTDNATTGFGSEEVARGGGRLHLARPSARRAPVAAPVLTADAAPRRLAFDESLPLRVRCDRPCDVRAVVGRRGTQSGPLALGVGSLPAAGRRTIRLRPSPFANIAPPGGGRVRVLIRTFARDGVTFAERTLQMRLSREPVPPLPRPQRVEARRHGQAIVVTWTYPRYRDPVLFLVSGRDAAGRGYDWRPSLGQEVVESRPHQAQRRVVLRPGRPGAVRTVEVRVERMGPRRTRTMIVPVAG